MAEEKKTTTKTRKVKEDVVNIDYEKELKKVKEEKDEMAELIKQMKEQLDSLKNNQPQVIIQSNNNLSRSVKVISMLDNSYTLSTQPKCRGNIVRFEKYGDSKMVKFTDLQAILQIYGNQFEKGFAVLTSKKDYEDLGIADVYDKVINKEKMDSLLLLKDFSDVDIIIGIEDEIIFDNIIRMIANKVVEGYPYDQNIYRYLQSETDIDEYVKSIKEDKELIENSKEE